MKIVLAVIVLVVILLPQQSLAISQQGIVKLENKQRVNQLKIDRKLTKIAKIRAEEMARLDYFSHISTNNLNRLLARYNYQYILAGEVLARGFRTNKEVVEAWRASISHKALVDNENFKYTGVATVKSGGQWIIVQVFSITR